MNIITELLRYLIIILIGLLLISWYEIKKGLELRIRTSLMFLLCWKAIIFFIVIIMNLIFELYLSETLLDTMYYFIIYPIILLVLSFIFNIILGVKIFELFYHQKAQEFTIIIFLIVIIEIILESLFFYLIIIPETLISHYNF